MLYSFPLLFLLGRVLLGGYFVLSGIGHFRNFQGTVGYAKSKSVPLASIAVAVTGLMMIAGGAGILLGAWVQYAIFLLALFLIVVSFKMHQYWKIDDPMQKMGEKINFQKNLGLLGAILMLLAIPLSVWTSLL